MSPRTPYLAAGVTLVALLFPVTTAAAATAYTCDGHQATLVGTAEAGRRATRTSSAMGSRAASP